MSVQQKKQPIYVTAGFLEKFNQVTQGEDASFKEMAQLLVVQPRLIGHLLNEANLRCEKHKSVIAKPKSVHGVIAILGLYGTIDACSAAEEVPPNEAVRLRDQTVDTYAFAVVLSELAERKLGRFYAPDFFMIGLITPLVGSEQVNLNKCHEDVVRHFEGEIPKGHPTIPEALALAADFKARRPTEHPELLLIWKNAYAHARGMLA